MFCQSCTRFSYCNTTSLPLCPDCSLVECVPKIEASDCPEGTNWEDNIIWGCCPACTRRIEVGKLQMVFFSSSILSSPLYKYYLEIPS